MDGFDPHDHSGCAARAVAAAEATCAARALRLTPVRRRVLQILAAEHRAFGAYEVLGKLDGAAPPTVYRALDFLVEHGFAHRIERLSAFVACGHPGADHAPAFLICRACEAVAEAPLEPARTGLGRAAAAAGFEMERACFEAEGLCPRCAAA